MNEAVSIVYKVLTDTRFKPSRLKFDTRAGTFSLMKTLLRTHVARESLTF